MMVFLAGILIGQTNWIDSKAKGTEAMLRHRCTFTLLAAVLTCGHVCAQAPILKANSLMLKINTPAAAAPSLDPYAGETKAARDARMGWWREAKFGLLIHWGLYAVPARMWGGKPIDELGEWIMYVAKIPVKDYAALAPQVRELMACHLAILWWDTPVDMSRDDIALLTASAALDYLNAVCSAVADHRDWRLL